MKLSYAILVCNERDELEKLINKILEFKDDEDEIVIVADSDSLSDAVADYLIELEKSGVSKFHTNPLNKDFAQQKNFLMSKCGGDHIINIDADEIPSDGFMVNIKDIITLNPDIELIAVPRVNIVNGITPDYVRQMNWNQNNQGWINFPDYQLRIIKNNGKIKWQGAVHERPIGSEMVSTLPPMEEMGFYHIKDFERQKRQNEFYNTIG